MSYQHILIAVDLTPDSHILISKAVRLANALGAELSLVHVDPSYEKLCDCSGLLDIDLHDNCKVAIEEALTKLKELTRDVDCPITHHLVGTGDYGNVLQDVIKKYDIDLVVCGHHHDFLSRLFSSNQPVLNKLEVEMLIIPLNDDA